MLLTEIRTDAEYEFLKLWNSCEWMTWDRYPESIFMVSEGEVLFEQDWKNNYLYCKYTKVWSLFELEFGYNNMQINDMISDLLEEHLKNEVLTPFHFSFKPLHGIEEHFKKGVLTPPVMEVGVVEVVSVQLEEHFKKGILTPTHEGGYRNSQLEEKMSKGTLKPFVGSLIDHFEIIDKLNPENAPTKIIKKIINRSDNVIK
jgi:hypothetical protein